MEYPKIYVNNKEELPLPAFTISHIEEYGDTSYTWEVVNPVNGS